MEEPCSRAAWRHLHPGTGRGGQVQAGRGGPCKIVKVWVIVHAAAAAAKPYFPNRHPNLDVTSNLWCYSKP